jgi:3-oxoacyl-[acyl-carrier-protein] synthase III
LFGDEVAAGVGGQGGGAEVVAQEVVERAVDAEGEALCAGVVVFGDGAAALLVVVADEEGRFALLFHFALLDVFETMSGTRLHLSNGCLR